MGDAHGGVGSVDALTAGAGGAVGVDAQVGLVDLNIDLIGLGQHGHRRGRRLDATLGLGLGDALHAVHAGLVLHDGVDPVALDLELDGLEAAGLRGAGVEHRHLPLLGLDEALVHLEEVAREDSRLVAARRGTDLDDGVLLVHRVARDEHDLDIFLELGQLCLVLGDLHLEHLLLVGVGGVVQHLLGDIDIVEGTQVLASGLHQVGLMGVLLVEAGEFLDIAGDGGVGELLLELLESDDDLLKLVAHGCSLCVGCWRNVKEGLPAKRRARRQT